jgi:hypothetical protein
MYMIHFARNCGAILGVLTLCALSACDRESGGGTSALRLTPTVSVSAVIGGGRQTVSLSFNSSDTQTYTNLSVISGLSPMPAGWSGPATFSCASISTGSGCLLNLIYKPTAVSAGVLTIDYSFTGNGGAVQKATATINYASTSNNNVVATASPAGQITAMVGHGSQTVAVTFTTDDGNPATGLVLSTDLATLPSGWKSKVTSFDCVSVSTGSGCQLQLIYTPPAIATGTLSLNYTYKDNSGDTKAGTLALAYVSTESDNVVGTVVPSGQIVSALGSTALAVTVTFTTDDGNAATALSLTSDLTALPSGWFSGSSGLTCATVSTGNSCQLHLSFAPVAFDDGTLALHYSYVDVGGHAKTGTVNVPYLVTSHNSVLGNSGGTVRVKVGASKQAQIIFTTNDGNIATDFSITSNLTALPAGWSGTNGFTCSAVSTGSGCALTLTYAPTVNATGTITLNFSYIDSAFTAKTGSAVVSYSNPHLYQPSTGLEFCPINLDGTLGTCAVTASSLALSSFAYGAVGFSGSFAYYPDYTNGEIWLCDVMADGSVTGCTVAYSLSSGSLYSVAANGGFLYVATSAGTASCSIDALGAVSNCSATQSGIGLYSDGMAFVNGFAYLGSYGAGIDTCTVADDGSLTNCALVNTSTFSNQVSAVSASNGYLYVANNNVVTSCLINQNGTLGGCTNYTVNSASDYWYGIAVLADDLYVAGYPAGNSPGTTYHCNVNANTGVVSSCVAAGGLSGTSPITLQ